MSESSLTNARRMMVFDAVLGMFPPGRLVDLGAGHGLFSKRAADAGWQVTAVDARTERFPADDRITWKQSDVRDTDLSGYDLILCLGLYYHLTLDDQIDLVRRASGTPLVIDTHLDVGVTSAKHNLSDRRVVDGYEGRLYTEVPDTTMSSWKNDLSFWPTPASFYRLLAEHGYHVVLPAEPPQLVDRRFYVALPTPSPESYLTA